MGSEKEKWRLETSGRPMRKAESKKKWEVRENSKSQEREAGKA